ncbi:MAG: hypothetical protein QXS42_05535 [Zestosphaera sp.]
MGLIERFVMLYTGLTSSFNVLLLLLRESRIDAYVALNILSFYISYSIMRPFPKTNTPVKLLHAMLLTVFMMIVGIRVYEVLVG